MTYAGVGGFLRRIAWAYLSELIGRRMSAILIYFGCAATLAIAGIFATSFIGAASVFWLFIVINRFFGDGGFAMLGPYAAEV